MALKVGDLVKIKDKNNYTQHLYTEDMLDLVGCVGKIVDMQYNSQLVLLDIDYQEFIWHKSILDKVVIEDNIVDIYVDIIHKMRDGAAVSSVGS
jgi:hypothetical protein